MSSNPQNKGGSSQNRRPDGTLLPGHTANPGGRPKGLQAEIRKQSKDGDGAEIVAFHFATMRGELYRPNAKGSGKVREKVPVKSRQVSGIWLGDHLWGRAVAVVDFKGERQPLEQYTDEQLDNLILERALEQAAGRPELLAKLQSSLAAAEKAQQKPEEH